VPVGEDVRLDDDLLAAHALDRVPAAVDLRLDAIDDDPRWSVCDGRRGRRRGSGDAAGRHNHRSRLDAPAGMPGARHDVKKVTRPTMRIDVPLSTPRRTRQAW
jgi:hypothetical protein